MFYFVLSFLVDLNHIICHVLSRVICKFTLASRFTGIEESSYSYRRRRGIVITQC